MEIRLLPEIEALIRQDVQRGPYKTVDEFVEHAIAMLHEQEAWLAEHRTEIEEQIAGGMHLPSVGNSLTAMRFVSNSNELKRARLGQPPRE
jgi:Arc/MetJ-type ribon-helix-helix transcriptional regulator